MLASKTKVRLVLLATFALGGLTGALITNLLNTAPPRGIRGIEEMTREVKLDPPQRQQVEQILTRTQHEYENLQREVRPRFEEIRQEVNPRFEAIRSATRTKIRSLLSPEQQALYDEWNRKRDAQREKRFADRDKAGKDKK